MAVLFGAMAGEVMGSLSYLQTRGLKGEAESQKLGGFLFFRQI